LQKKKGEKNRTGRGENVGKGLRLLGRLDIDDASSKKNGSRRQCEGGEASTPKVECENGKGGGNAGVRRESSRHCVVSFSSRGLFQKESPKDGTIGEGNTRAENQSAEGETFRKREVREREKDSQHNNGKDRKLVSKKKVERTGPATAWGGSGFKIKKGETLEQSKGGGAGCGTAGCEKDNQINNRENDLRKTTIRFRKKREKRKGKSR